MFYKAGSVGKFLPGVDYRCRSLEGVEADGVLEVRGPNVMIGYLRESHAGVIERLDTGDQESGWYDTGDIVNIDEDGFIFIVGREKRFAKIAGEMISLLSVERILEDTLSDARCAVIARRHATRGEELILFTDSEMLTRKEVQSVIREAGLSLAAAPREVRCLSSLPLLPSGKVDYALLREMLLSEEVVSEDRQVS
jgi:acyl-[acyl-carrier-protein]-phospholipid O-acyltransferase/long-chain-fatty-acid--[acyl-carrier-protein] ligase